MTFLCSGSCLILVHRPNNVYYSHKTAEEGLNANIRMKISVAMCTFNGQKFIEEQLVSIFNQTLKIDELVIYDDCSTDNTIDIIRSFINCHQDFPIFLHKNENNIGFRGNFRKAVSDCTGDYIFFSDQDDIWDPSKVEYMVTVFKQHPDCLTLISDYYIIDENKTRINETNEVQSLTVSERVLLAPEELVKLQVEEGLMGTVGQGCATAVSRTLAEMYLRCDLNWAHDHLVDCIAALHNGLYFTKKKLIDYRVHENNTISIPRGKCNQRKVSGPEKIKETLVCFRYVFLKATKEECLNRIYDMGSYEEVEALVGCCEQNKQRVQDWRTVREERMTCIESHQLLKYLMLRSKYPQYFSNAVSHHTYEQHLLSMFYDIGSIVKRR